MTTKHFHIVGLPDDVNNKMFSLPEARLVVAIFNLEINILSESSQLDCGIIKSLPGDIIPCNCDT